jgi:RraA family protein
VRPPSGLDTSALSDALGKSGAMDHDMQCRSGNARMSGPAYTVRVHTADILMVARALSLCPPGHVLVIDGQGELNTALWGGITTEAARLKGLAGVVVDGAIRDSAEIRANPLPVFARAVVPNAGGAEYAGELQVPVSCGGVVVCPGDWLVGDDDGVVVVPAARMDEAIEKAGRILAAEAVIKARVAAGEDLAAILHSDQVLERKSASEFIPQLRAGDGG